MVPTITVVPALVAVNDGVFPFPLAGKPIAGLLLVQVKVAPAGVLIKLEAATVAPLHTDALAGTVVVGVGNTEWLNATCVPGQPFKVGVTRTMPTIKAVLALVATKAGTLPVPLAARPIATLLLVQA